MACFEAKKEVNMKEEYVFPAEMKSDDIKSWYEKIREFHPRIVRIWEASKE